MGKVSVGIVVVTYNRLELLREVIVALREQSFRDFSIVVVNNGSTDGTADWLSQQSDITVITQENLGGAGGFHSGMKYVAENGFDYCWVMDDDVICSADALKELYDAYHRKDGIGFVCSKVNGIDNNPMNTPVIDDRATANGYADFTDLIEFGMVKVRMATFVSVFCSTATIRQLGLPIKQFFIWGDDTEYTMRISEKHDCYMACRSIVLHKRTIQKNISFENETDPKRLKFHFYNIRNNAYVHLHYDKLYEMRRKRIGYFLNLYKKSLKYLLKGKMEQAAIQFKATWSLRDFNPEIEFPRQ